MKKSKAIRLVISELDRAQKHHAPMHSPHEGHSIIREELEELFDEVRKKEKNQSKKLFAGEAKQIAAMALRFMIDLA